MLFSSLTFLFIFLPLVVGVYFVLPRRFRVNPAPIIARAVKEVFEDGSVTNLFDGNA